MQTIDQKIFEDLVDKKITPEFGNGEHINIVHRLTEEELAVKESEKYFLCRARTKLVISCPYCGHEGEDSDIYDEEFILNEMSEKLLIDKTKRKCNSCEKLFEI